MHETLIIEDNENSGWWWWWVVTSRARTTVATLNRKLISFSPPLCRERIDAFTAAGVPYDLEMTSSPAALSVN